MPYTKDIKKDLAEFKKQVFDRLEQLEFSIRDPKNHNDIIAKIDETKKEILNKLDKPSNVY